MNHWYKLSICWKKYFDSASELDFTYAQVSYIFVWMESKLLANIEIKLYFFVFVTSWVKKQYHYMP